MTELNRQLCESLVLAKKDDLDMVTSVDVQVHNTMSSADSMVWDFDLKDLWLTKSRWSMMVRQYLDADDVIDWLDRATTKIGTRGRGIAALRTKVVKPRGGDETGHTNKATRRWGSCMLAVTYKAQPQPQITLYSRTSYLGYLGGLDLTVAWMLGKYLASALGVDVSTFKFVWYNEALQYHNFKSLAFLLNHPDPDMAKMFRKVILKGKTPKKLGVDDFHVYPALALSRKWMQNMIQMDKEGKTLGDMTYNTYRRIRRRYHTEVLGYERAQEFEGWSYWKRDFKDFKIGDEKEFFKAYQPLPSVKAASLDLSPIRLAIDGTYGGEYDGSDEYEEDDE
jgi:hypothetical protein